MFDRTAPLRNEIECVLPERPFSVDFWDGTTLASTTGDGPVFHVRSPAALAHALRAPGQLGIGRAYVSGDLEVDDMDKAIDLLDAWRPPPLDRGARARLAIAALRAAGLRRPPPVPKAELRPSGRRHSRQRDARAVRHHYDLPAEFFALFLDDSMTYSCGVFSRGATTLEEAQEAKLELVCEKLGLDEGERVLDIGCGWGSFAIHAARTRGVRVLGITLSGPQAVRARRRVAELGLDDRVQIRVADYRELDEEPFDAVVSIGMVEHVGASQIDTYARTIAGALRPGGRALNHGIARLRHGEPEAAAFSERYVFPDAAPLHVSRVLLALERAGLVTDHVEGFAGDYATTLTHWLNRFEDRLDEAVRLAGPERVRVWRLYLRAARQGFLTGFTSVYQVRCRCPAQPDGAA